VDVRRPWGRRVEEGTPDERRHALSTEDVSPFPITIMSKVAIIGATGKVGRFAAYTVSEIPHVREIVLFGRPGREELLEGIKQDFIDGFAASGRDVTLRWSTEPSDLAGTTISIVTAGFPRQAGQNRIDLAYENAKIIASTAQMIGKIAPETILFMVTNPVDVMTAVALRYSGLEPRQVFGLGTHLDSMRLKALIAHFFNVHVSEVHTRIIGEHGDSMVPLWSATTIGGITINNLPAFSILPVDRMMDTVKTAGENIIRRKGATIYGPGEAIATLVKTILGDENRILTVSCYVKSEVHDIGDVCIGVPARINRRGVFPVPIRIEAGEISAFKESAEKIRHVTADIFAKLEEPSG
jgi:malate dehydrogenase